MIEKVSILLFKRLPLFGFLIFQFINAPTSLCLNRDKTKRQSGLYYYLRIGQSGLYYYLRVGQSGKNTTLTPTKILSKKQDHSLINFQKKKESHRMHEACVMRLVYYNQCVCSVATDLKNYKYHWWILHKLLRSPMWLC